jgi:hypothetical protein
MDSFPTIAAPARINYGLSDPYLEDEFESGDAAARPEFTVPREKPMSLSWNAMKPADLATLRTFYDGHRGVRFSWTDPVSDEAKTCRFVGDCLSWKVSTALAGHYQVTLTMRRVS